MLALRRLDHFIHPGSNNFSLIRLFAAVAVVISHAIYLSTGDDVAQPLSGVTRYNLGQHAVNVFFVISGLTVAGSLERSSSLLSFALARALRILPGLVACVLITVFVLGPIVSTFALTDYFADRRTYIYAFQNLLLGKISATLPGVFAGNPLPLTVNESLWTLKYEALCYAGLALLAALGAWRSERAFRTVLGLSLLVCVPITLTGLPPKGATLVDNVVRFWLCFLLGVSFYRYRARLTVFWPILVGVSVLWWLSWTTSLEPVLTFALAGYGAVWLATLPLGGLRSWANRTDLSYGVYIYGWPTSQTLAWAVPGIGPTALAVVSLIVAGLLGWLSWTWVERPSLHARGPLARWSEGWVGTAAWMPGARRT